MYMQHIVLIRVNAYILSEYLPDSLKLGVQV